MCIYMGRTAEFEMEEICLLAQSSPSKKQLHYRISFKFLIMFLGCDKKEKNSRGEDQNGSENLTTAALIAHLASFRILHNGGGVF